MEPDPASGKVVVVDDSEIVRSSLEEPELFESLFDHHHRAIWRYLARVGGPDRADDLAGEVFTIAFARRDGYDPRRGSVRAWLYGIAANLLRTRFRSDGRQARAFRRAASLTAADPSATDAVDDQLCREAQLTEVLDALSQLPAMDREVITLFVWGELSYEEIAATLGVELGTVRSRLARARERLRELAGLSGEVTGEAR